SSACTIAICLIESSSLRLSILNDGPVGCTQPLLLFVAPAPTIPHRMALRRNILIFHQAALGDFIVTWPLAMALSRIMPQSRVIYVTHSQKGKLAERVLHL